MPGATLSAVWPLPEPVTPDHVLQSLNLLVARHDVLHTSYPAVGEYSADMPLPRTAGDLTQVVLPPRPVPVELISGAPGDVVSHCRAALAAFAPAGFDPLDPSPLKARLVCTENGVRAVVVGVSHQAVDAVGFEALRGEFLAMVNAGVSRRDSAVLPPARQPRTQVAAESDGRLRAAGEIAVEYFASVLRRAPTRFLSTGRPRSQQCASSTTVLSADLADDVTRIARACRATAPSILSTLVMLLMAAYTGERLVLLRSLYHRRQSLRGEPYVAPQNLAALVLLELPERCTLQTAFGLGRQAAMLGFRHTDYDPFALAAQEYRTSRSRGTPVDGFCLFNFMGPARRPTPQAAVGGPRGAEPPSAPASTPGAPIPLNMQCIVACSYHPTGALTVQVQIDEHFVGVSAGAAFASLRMLASFAADNLGATVQEGAHVVAGRR